jgi:hypothetical protein
MRLSLPAAFPQLKRLWQFVEDCPHELARADGCGQKVTHFLLARCVIRALTPYAHRAEPPLREACFALGCRFPELQRRQVLLRQKEQTSVSC